MKVLTIGFHRPSTDPLPFSGTENCKIEIHDFETSNFVDLGMTQAEMIIITYTFYNYCL